MHKRGSNHSVVLLCHHSPSTLCRTHQNEGEETKKPPEKKRQRAPTIAGTPTRQLFLAGVVQNQELVTDTTKSDSFSAADSKIMPPQHEIIATMHVMHQLHSSKSTLLDDDGGHQPTAPAFFTTQKASGQSPVALAILYSFISHFMVDS
jgi:hypothetical protein